MPPLAPQFAEVAQLVADRGRASRWPTACGIAGFWCSAPVDPEASARPIGRDHRGGHRSIPGIIRRRNLISDANLATRYSRGYSQST